MSDSIEIFETLEGRIDFHILENISNQSFLNETTSDCLFMFDDGTIPAHTNILAVASHVFRVMFAGHLWTDQNGIIKITDMDRCTFIDFLKTIYLPKFELIPSRIPKLIYLTTKYQLKPTYMEMYENAIKLIMNPVNALESLKMLHMYKFSENFKKIIKTEIGNNIETIFETTEFLALDADSLKEVLSLEAYNLDDELQLLNGLLKWARYHCDEQTKEDYVKLRIFIGEDIFKLIRFPTMKMASLIRLQTHNYKHILTENELENINLFSIGERTTHTLTLEGFSIIKRCRVKVLSSSPKSKCSLSSFTSSSS
jgi:hypothetical protein